jgi:arginyl-tRNA--protein-N-Asp/Glu arginylyltransferase
METVFHYTASPSRCGYLPDRVWSLEYELTAALEPAEYLQRMREGWRRFGFMMFRPQCPSCQACQSLRVPTAPFQPSRSQRRARQRNQDDVRLTIGKPSVSRAKLRLYDAFHAFQAGAKGWPLHPAKDAAGYRSSFVDNPFAVEEWCYWLEDELIGVGYVDVLPGGMSAIYFFYDPAQRDRSLGTWNVLSVLDAAAERGVPYVYLGYFVEGCESLEYKATFRPNEVLRPDGSWRPFRLHGK